MFRRDVICYIVTFWPECQEQSYLYSSGDEDVRAQIMSLCLSHLWMPTAKIAGLRAFFSFGSQHLKKKKKKHWLTMYNEPKLHYNF